MRTRVRSLVPVLLALASLCAVTQDLTAQAQGTVTGSVLDRASRQPLPGVQVFIEGTGIGGISNANGRYLLANVSAGEVRITAELIGYGSAQQTATVAAGQTIAVNFELAERALSLDEIIVTGTAGGTQRRAVGNDVARLDVGAVIQQKATLDVQTALSTRVPGVTISAGAGNPGSGGSIRVRGLSSFTQSNEPIVYIDGVRMDNNVDAGRGQMNRMNDVDPSEIESIEVIKGPAAATLYGTEASGGVIQIITKRGRVGAPAIDLSIMTGANWLANPAERVGTSYWRDPKTNQVLSFNLYEEEERNGKVGAVFQTGLLQSYTASISGGAEAIRYFGSLNWDDNDGVEPHIWQKAINARLNLDATVHEKLELGMSVGVLRNSQRMGGQTTTQTFQSLIWGRPGSTRALSRGFYRAPPEAHRKLEYTNQNDRAIVSGRMMFRPWSWLAQRLVVGADVGVEENDHLTPRAVEGETRWYGSADNGLRQIETNSTQLLTVDYSATADFDVSPTLNTQTSVGFQYYSKELQSRSAQGQGFSTPTLSTVSAAAITFGGESFVENSTVGGYVQEQIGWNNRVFLTAALRMDDNSAFGSNFSAAKYPKLSATWVVSEEPFWNVGPINQLRLRAAWGASGRQPDAFAAQQLWDTDTGPGGSPVVVPDEIGNPDLKPERGEELELGFDVGLLDDRVSANFTYYNRTTKDGILQRTNAPSSGFPGFQFINAGEVKAWGTEVALNATLIDRDAFGWDLAITGSHMGNRIESLGGYPPFIVSGRHLSSNGNVHHEGYSLGAVWYKKVVSADHDANGNLINVMCEAAQDRLDEVVPCANAERVYWGEGAPTWEFGAESGVTIKRDLRLSGRIDGRGGWLISNVDLMAAYTGFANNWHSANLLDYPIYHAYHSLVGREPLGYVKGSFIKLRELSATYTLPEHLISSFGLSRASVTVSGRNLAILWWPGKWVTLPYTDEPIQGPGNPKGGTDHMWDPEMENSHPTLAGETVGQIPPTETLVTSIRLSF